MKSIDFQRLCLGTSVELGLADLTALADGSDVIVDNVRIRTYFVDGQGAFLLVAYLGEVSADDRVSVCETLLAIQLAAWDEPLVRFGMHPLDDALVLCAHIALDENVDRESLANLVKSIVGQVVEWREVHLAGKVNGQPRDAAPRSASAPVVNGVLHA